MKEKLVGFTLVSMPEAPQTLPTVDQMRRVLKTEEVAAAKAVPEKKPRTMKVKKPHKTDLDFGLDVPPSKRPLWHLAVHRLNPPRSTGHYFARQSDAFWALFSLVAWIPSNVGLMIAIDSVRGGPRFVAERRSGKWTRIE